MCNLPYAALCVDIKHVIKLFVISNIALCYVCSVLTHPTRTLCSLRLPSYALINSCGGLEDCLVQ
jgi:hypothetical protein